MTFTVLHPTRRHYLDAVRADHRVINLREDIDAARLAELESGARAVCRALVPYIFDDVDEPFMGAQMREAGRA